MELTMIRQFGRKGMLSALFHDNEFEDEATRELVKILEPKDVYEFKRPPNHMTAVEVADFLKDGEELPRSDYKNLLKYLNDSGRKYYTAYPSPGIIVDFNTLILPTAVHYSLNFKLDGKTYSHKTSREGGSHIKFYVPGGATDVTQTGCIEEIWELPLEGILHTFLVVNEHMALAANQKRHNPYSTQPCSLLQSQLVCQELSGDRCIIEPRHIICHLAVYKRPPKTYKNIDQATMTITWAINRGKR